MGGCYKKKCTVDFSSNEDFDVFLDLWQLNTAEVT